MSDSRPDVNAGVQNPAAASTDVYALYVGKPYEKIYKILRETYDVQLNFHNNMETFVGVMNNKNHREKLGNKEKIELDRSLMPYNNLAILDASQQKGFNLLHEIVMLTKEEPNLSSIKAAINNIFSLLNNDAIWDGIENATVGITRTRAFFANPKNQSNFKLTPFEQNKMKGNSIDSHLMFPVQIAPRYLMLLADLKKALDNQLKNELDEKSRKELTECADLVNGLLEAVSIKTKKVDKERGLDETIVMNIEDNSKKIKNEISELVKKAANPQPTKNEREKATKALETTTFEKTRNGIEDSIKYCSDTIKELTNKIGDEKNKLETMSKSSDNLKEIETESNRLNKNITQLEGKLTQYNESQKKCESQLDLLKIEGQKLQEFLKLAKNDYEKIIGPSAPGYTITLPPNYVNPLRYAAAPSDVPAPGDTPVLPPRDMPPSPPDVSNTRTLPTPPTRPLPSTPPLVSVAISTDDTSSLKHYNGVLPPTDLPPPPPVQVKDMTPTALLKTDTLLSLIMAKQNTVRLLNDCLKHYQTKEHITIGEIGQKMITDKHCTIISEAIKNIESINCVPKSDEIGPTSKELRDISHDLNHYIEVLSIVNRKNETIFGIFKKSDTTISTAIHAIKHILDSETTKVKAIVQADEKKENVEKGNSETPTSHHHI